MSDKVERNTGLNILLKKGYFIQPASYICYERSCLVSIKKKRILDLVEENYVFASVLHHFGIDFYDYPEHKLVEVCQEKGLKPELVIAGLEDVIEEDQAHIQYLMSLPMDILLTYLRHKHFAFIKQTLPYLAKLIDSYPTKNEPSIIKDIRIMFPLFVEDFISHMYEEEENIFNFIKKLDNAVKGKFNYSKLFFSLKSNSIKTIAQQHSGQDDVMLGIRELTEDYTLRADSPVLLKVIYSELKSFEKNLIIHARIENEVLFPKALLLEKELYKHISNQSYLN